MVVYNRIFLETETAVMPDSKKAIDTGSRTFQPDIFPPWILHSGREG